MICWYQNSWSAPKLIGYLAPKRPFLPQNILSCRLIWCPVGWWLCARAVSSRTPIYFMIVTPHFLFSFTLSVYLSIIGVVNWRENPTITTLKVRKRLISMIYSTKQDVAKPATDLALPSVTICSPQHGGDQGGAFQ